MTLDLLQGYSVIGVRNKYLIQKISKILTDLSIISWLTQIYFFIHFLCRVFLKRSLSGRNFKQEYSQTPNISLEGMPGTPQDLRCYVLRRATICIEFSTLGVQLPSKTKINQFDMTSLIL